MATRLYQRDGSVLRQVSLGGDATAEELEGLEAMITQAQATADAAQATADGAQATAAGADSKAVAAQAAADGRLPLNGGIMTGPLVISAPLESRLLIQNNSVLNSAPYEDGQFSNNHVSFIDKESNILSSLHHFHWADNQGESSDMDSLVMRLHKGNAYSDLRVNGYPDGTFKTVSRNPVENQYDAQVDTLYASINRHPQKTVVGSNNFNFYVGNVAGASDTADLNKGRGLTQDKPFLSLPALALFISQSYAMRYAPNINLLSDLEITSTITVYGHNHATWNFNGNGHSIIYKGTSPAHLMAVVSGSVFVNNIGFKAEPSVTSFLVASGEVHPSLISIGNSVSFNGTTTQGTLRAFLNGTVYAPYAMSGNVTGPRYWSSKGSRILVNGQGPNAIPGTAAGTCDDTSIYG